MKQTLTAGLLLLAVSAAPALALESPYLPLAQAGGGALALAEEPAQNEDIKTIMVRYKQGDYFEKIALMPVEQRRKLMDYYKKGRAAGIKDRLLAVGLASIVGGYSDIEAVKVFVSEYQKTGKTGKNIPLPHVNFVNATEDFPEAMQVMFASELEATKKMEAHIKAILEAITADAERRTADAEREGADARRRSAKAQEDIKLLEQILKAMK